MAATWQLHGSYMAATAGQLHGSYMAATAGQLHGSYMAATAGQLHGSYMVATCQLQHGGGGIHYFCRDDAEAIINLGKVNTPTAALYGLRELAM